MAKLEFRVPGNGEGHGHVTNPELSAGLNNLEVFPDRGDLDMYQVVRALHEVGYEGAIDYDHIMGISTDTPVGREYIAFCVGHARGMLQGLANS